MKTIIIGIKIILAMNSATNSSGTVPKIGLTQTSIEHGTLNPPLELPLIDFPPNQEDLLNAVQNRMGGIGSRSRGRTRQCRFPTGVTRTRDRPSHIIG